MGLTTSSVDLSILAELRGHSECPPPKCPASIGAHRRLSCFLCIPPLPLSAQLCHCRPGRGGRGLEHTVLRCPPLLVSEPAGKPVPVPSAGEKPAAQAEASAGAVCDLGRIGFGFRRRSTKARWPFLVVCAGLLA